MTPQKGMKQRHLRWRQWESVARSHSKTRLQSEEICNSIVADSAGRRRSRKTNRMELKRQRAPKDMNRARACSFGSSQMARSSEKAQVLLAVAPLPAKIALSSSNHARMQSCHQKHMNNWKRRSRTSIWKSKDAPKIPLWPKVSTSRQWKQVTIVKSATWLANWTPLWSCST